MVVTVALLVVNAFVFLYFGYALCAELWRFFIVEVELDEGSTGQAREGGQQGGSGCLAYCADGSQR